MKLGIRKISIRAYNSLKIGTFIGSFKLKFTGELFVMTMKNDAKFEIEVTYQFKIYMRNLTNFDWSIPKSQKLAL